MNKDHTIVDNARIHSKHPNVRMSGLTPLKDSTLDLLINEEIKKISTTNSLIATSLWSDRELIKILNEASFDHIQIFEETKTFSHETADDWWDSLWSHATRAKLEQISPAQLNNLREKVISMATSLD